MDIIINNAAQTIRRPSEFYGHLRHYESLPLHLLPKEEQAILTSHAHDAHRLGNTSPDHKANDDDNLQPPSQKKMKLSLPSTSNDRTSGSDTMVSVANTNSLFPEGLLDSDGQQVDLRAHNSWVSTLDELSLGEMMEVLMINTVAPFILNKDLKSHLTKSPHSHKFIVNVSAMEGKFSRKFKSEHHPHTNMAKASLNMMTRTAALGYVESGIYMTSVDTGWVTDERPAHIAGQQKLKGFSLPLDIIDGTARVYDPIVHGLNPETEVPHYAVFLKDYKPTSW